MKSNYAPLHRHRNESRNTERKKKNLIFKYPKFAGLIAAIILAYFIFRHLAIGDIFSKLGAFSYLGVFIAGMCYSFGFTAPFSTGFFFALHPGNVLLAGMIGGIGAMFSDLFIFQFIRISFKDEIEKIKKEKISVYIRNCTRRILGRKIRKFLLLLIAGILIASPLPNETGIVIIAGFTKMKSKVIAAIGFILGTLGILTIIYLGILL